MFAGDLQLPSALSDANRESDFETLRRLSHDVMKIDRGELTALDAYRLYLPTDEDGSTWGFCLEAARITKTNDIMVLFRNDEEGGKEKKLRWLPLSSLCTKNQASLSYQVEYTGPTEEVMFEILRLIRDAFEFAADTDW
eukprot:CAMPEP_0172435476 /NCGR_PEP_ID=MMETSP1064-20121228/71199_1 /TAXON_ID=202472 /ORGANISM="Aulacoseira subarctica , Strain CCAP 1002/5" /LENGTH=138 /DNA_ID=CAMNT_0013183791 /DNA_START=163 /DNA_END=576 /DNA_ORIENTATION=+